MPPIDHHKHLNPHISLDTLTHEPKTQLAIAMEKQEELHIASKRRTTTFGLKHRLISLCIFVFISAVSWQTLKFFTGSDLPIVVVTSDTMLPSLKRGDALLIKKTNDPIRVGDIVLFTVTEKGTAISVAHRVIAVDELSNGKVHIVTRGDNNKEDDKTLYSGSKGWLTPNEIKGKAIASLPFVGWLTIVTDILPLKCILVVAIGVLATCV